MYSIQTVIYGIPLTYKMQKLMAQWEEAEDPRWTDGKNGPCGFTKLYSGAGEFMPGFCGVELGSYDECGDYVQIFDDRLEYKDVGSRCKKIPLIPTTKQIVKASKAVDKLDPAILALGPPIGLYIIFSTS